MNGDIERAFSTVNQAIEIATERHARLPECLAHIVRADLLLRSITDDEKAEGKQELERAQALIRETGATLFQTFISPSQDELNDARQTSTRAS